MAGKKGNYSNIVIYDEQRRYYYMWPQKNKPFLDDEIRSMGVGLLDQTRRAVQHIYGDVAAVNNDLSNESTSTVESFKVEASTSPNKNFVIKGGNAGGGSVDHPAILYVKGFYIFLTGDLEYKEQMYSSSIDLNTVSDKSKTLTPIPALTTPSVDRTDVVYAHLHFEEVSAATGSDLDVYLDSGLKNPIVGTETANRLRAVFDIRVREGWTDPVNKDIFNHNEFLGGITANDSNPIDNEYKIPIAVIYRKAFQDNINNSEIVDLLTLYTKRAFSLEEITYRASHGGYTQADVDEKGYTGFQAQFPAAIVDEGAFATGLNRGLDTEALNTNSVTPRTLDNDGKFFMDALMVGHETGMVTYETGAEDLGEGEVVAKNISTESMYAGYDMGVTGNRDYVDNINVYARGETGTAGVRVTVDNGDTGALAMQVRAIQGETGLNFYSVDYKGRVGINTLEPGWEPVKGEWNVERYNDGLFGETGVNVALDVDASARVRKHLFVDGDHYTHGDSYGKTWTIPAEISNVNPALLGYTGIPQTSGLNDTNAAVIIRRAVATHGVTGMAQAGYTGSAGQYECFDFNGERLFTIGDLGPEFDRVVKTLYGTGIRQAFVSDHSFMELPGGYGQVESGDIVSYTLELADGSGVTGALTLTQNGFNGVQEIRDDIIYNPGFGNPTGLYRTFDYTFYGITGIDSPVIQTRSGEAFGVQILQDPAGVTGSDFGEHGKLIIKDMPEEPVDVDFRSIASFKIERTLMAPLSIPYTSFHYQGSSQYGGDVRDLKFAKLDLGEAANAWLFNGDVFFNGVGDRNQVTFSPNVTFRDDVFMYGNLFADQLRFNFANVGNLLINNALTVDKTAAIREGLAVGEDALIALQALQLSNVNLKLYVKGDTQAWNYIAESEATDENILGGISFKSKRNNGDAYVRMAGSIGSETDPYGIHLIDDRPGRDPSGSDDFKDLVIDYSDGRGNFGQVNLVVKGDLTLNRGLISPFLAVGTDPAINTDYAFYCNGRAIINDILEVKALRFIGAEAPEGSTDIVTPANVAVIDNGAESQHNNENILREKKFTLTERVYLDNQNILGYDPFAVVPPPPPPGSDPRQLYWEAMVSTTNKEALWGHDTLSYTEEDFGRDGVGNEDNEIIVANVTEQQYQRFSFNRIIVASLGTLNIEWTGYAYDPSKLIDQDNVIQKYFFESPYFRNRDGGSTIDWMPGGGKFGDENLIVKVEANIIDTDSNYPDLYYLEAPIGLYIPKESWNGYGKLDNSYRSFSIWYPYELVRNQFNNINFENLTMCTAFGANMNWKIGVYPRLVSQQRLPFDSTAGSNAERMYTGKWDLDLVVYVPVSGRCSNMVGKLYISYMQS